MQRAAFFICLAVLLLQAAQARVGHAAAQAGAAAGSEKVAPTSLWGRFWDGLFGGKPEPRTDGKKAPVSMLAAKPPQHAQSIEKTRQMAKEDAGEIIHMHDQWASMEQEDQEEVMKAKEEDDDMRDFAQLRTVEKPRSPTGRELAHVAGPHISGFWSTMEHEDDGILNVLDASGSGGGLGTYNALTQLQNDKVGKAAAALDDHINVFEHMHFHDDSPEAKLIHEPFLSLEAKDDKSVRTIRDSPELQMLQVARRRQNAA